MSVKEIAMNIFDKKLIQFLFLSIFVTILGGIFIKKYFSKKSTRKTIPALKSSSIKLFCTFLLNVYYRRNYSIEFMLCQLLNFACGLCVLFNKDRIFRVGFGIIPWIFFFKPEAIEVILSSLDTIDKASEYNFLHPWLGTGLLTSSGNKWRIRRKLLTPSFHFKILEDFMPIFNEQSNILVSKLKEMKKTWIDIVPKITTCTLDIICETAMGVSINTQKGGCKNYVQAIHDIGNIVFHRVIQPWLHLDCIFYRTTSGKIFKSSVETIHEFTRKVIAEKKKEMIKKKHNTKILESNAKNWKKPKPFLELLLEHHLENPTFTEEDVREEVHTFMFEGHDTTAMSLNWTLYCVGRDKDIMSEIHRELDEIFAGDEEREITRNDLVQMKYLDCVIKESLRLYPSVPVLSRDVKESFEVMGYKINAGNVCLIFPWMLHRDPEIFPCPEKFDPQRFFQENIIKRHPYAYIPFSAGPRNCIGQKFAMMEEKTILANIFRSFSVSSKHPPDKVNVTPNLIIRNLEPLMLQFTCRTVNKIKK